MEVMVIELEIKKGKRILNFCAAISRIREYTLQEVRKLPSHS